MAKIQKADNISVEAAELFCITDCSVNQFNHYLAVSIKAKLEPSLHSAILLLDKHSGGNV